MDRAEAVDELVAADADDLPARVFEANACGVFVVTKPVPDVKNVFGLCESLILALPESIEELVRHANLSPTIARLARDVKASDEFRAKHSWDARLAQLVEGRDVP